MKKKIIIAAILAGVMAASCFAGCNGLNSGNGNGDGEKEEQGQQQGTFEKGEEVTAEEWAAAVNASLNSQNFTMISLISETKTVKGYYQGNEQVPVNIVNGYNVDYYHYIDLNNDNFFGYNILSKDLVSGFADLYSHQENYTEDWLNSLKNCLSLYGIYDDEDFEESGTAAEYGIKIDGKYYAVYAMLGAVPLSLNEEAYKDEEYEWSVEEGDFSGDLPKLNDAFSVQFAIEEGGEEKPLTELYEVFDYSDGVYTADLWRSTWYDSTMFTVSISFKDGHILSFEQKSTKSNVEEQDGLTVTSVREETSKICDIGKTTVKPTPDALKAVEDYIKENS